jgi:hypothetical protein
MQVAVNPSGRLCIEPPSLQWWGVVGVGAADYQILLSSESNDCRSSRFGAFRLARRRTCPSKADRRILLTRKSPFPTEQKTQSVSVREASW